MLTVTIMISASVLLSLSLLSFSQSVNPCPLLGPDFPPPTNLSGSNLIRKAQQAIFTSIEDAVRNLATKYGRLEPNATSFSIDLYSIYESDSLFTYHHSAPELANPLEGVSAVDSSTIYRIGSISKLLTMYLYLLEAGDRSFNDPITNYVPELAEYASKHAAASEANDIDFLDWNDITVGALASQMAGVPRDPSFGPALDAELAQIGLPPVPVSNFSFCGHGLNKLPCNRSAFFENYLQRHAVVAPFYTPIYSNSAFQILAYALENLTNSSFPNLFTNGLVNRLGLFSTSFSQPKNRSNSIIPINATASWYDKDLLDETPAGGDYSSINDMAKLGRSILNFEYLSPAMTRRWMKPVTFTSDPRIAVGSPWEIFRAPGNRTSFLYGKSGNIGVYSSQLSLWPDYGVGFTVFAAGKGSPRNVKILSDMLASTFYPALQCVAQKNAHAVYAGVYRSIDEVNSTITVTADDKPGLGITEWIYNGTDVFTWLAAARGLSPDSGSKISVRLYPTGLKSRKGDSLVRTGWRAVYEALPKLADPGAFSHDCITWIGVDGLSYGGVGTDEFLFNLGDDGKAVSVEPRVLRSELKISRKESGSFEGAMFKQELRGARHDRPTIWPTL